MLIVAGGGGSNGGLGADGATGGGLEGGPAHWQTSPGSDAIHYYPALSGTQDGSGTDSDSNPGGFGYGGLGGAAGGGGGWYG